MNSLRSILAIVCIFASGCRVEINTFDESESETLAFAAFLNPCIAVQPRLCLRRSTTGNSFFEPIDGFTFRWGHRVQLRVIKNKIINPTAGGSLYRYRLVEILSEFEDTLGTRYRYPLFELSENSFSSNGERFYMFGWQFDCGADVDCQTLVDLSGSYGQVNLEFEYVGDGQIQLVEWN